MKGNFHPERTRFGSGIGRSAIAPQTKVEFFKGSVSVISPRLLTVRWKGSVFSGIRPSEKFREVSGGDRMEVLVRGNGGDRGKLTIQMQRTYENAL